MFALERDTKTLYADLAEEQSSRLIEWLTDQAITFEHPDVSGSPDPQYWVEVHGATAEQKRAILRVIA